MASTSSETDKEANIKEHKIRREDLLFDIYMYEKELTVSNLREEDRNIITEHIKEAEKLFKTIK